MRARCEVHRIAVGPNGCLLCRRGPEVASAPSRRAAPSHPAAPAPATEVEASAPSQPRQLNIHIHPLLFLLPVAALVLHFALPGFTWLDPGRPPDVLAAGPGRDDTAGLPTATKPTAPGARPRAVAIQPAFELETLPARGPALADGPVELAPQAEPSGNRVRRQHDLLRERAQRAEEQARQFAAERERVVVTVYYTEWCPSCRDARAYLQQRGIRFEEHDIERDSRARSRQRLLNPKGSIPTLLIEDQVLVGFNAARIEKALDRAARAQIKRAR